MDFSIKVRDAMRREVLTGRANTTVAHAAKAMGRRGVGSIVVVENGKPIGIVTERDILIKVVSKDLRPSTVELSDIMSKPLITTNSDTPIATAVNIMLDKNIRRLPIVDGDELVGILSVVDILNITPELAQPLMDQLPFDQEESKPGICEYCGQFADRLYFKNNIYVCEDCFESM